VGHWLKKSKKLQIGFIPQQLRRIVIGLSRIAKTWIPGLDVKNNCHARNANELEKKLFKSAQKDDK
jgi:hypothetical protein